MIKASIKFENFSICRDSTADDLIKHFSVIERNYYEAWQLLKDRVSMKRHIISRLVKKFMKLLVVAIEPEAESRDPFLVHRLTL